MVLNPSRANHKRHSDLFPADEGQQPTKKKNISTPEKTQSKQGDLNYFSPIPFTEYLKPIPWQSLITSARIGIFFHHCGKHSPIAVEEGFTFRTGGFTMLTLFSTELESLRDLDLLFAQVFHPLIPDILFLLVNAVQLHKRNFYNCQFLISDIRHLLLVIFFLRSPPDRSWFPTTGECPIETVIIRLG